MAAGVSQISTQATYGGCASVVSADTLDAGLSVASPKIAKKLGLFSQGSIHTEGFPALINDVTALLNKMHRHTVEMGMQNYESRGFVDGVPPTPMKPLDPKHMGGGVFSHMQLEQTFPIIEGQPPVKAFRQAVRFNFDFTRQLSRSDFNKLVQNTKIAFGVSDTEAQEFVDLLKKLNEEFRREHSISDFSDVRFVINGLTQLVTGPISKDALLLPRHTDGPADQTHATILMRGPDELKPLHKVVMFPEGGPVVEKTSGMVVFNGVEHEVVADYDSDEKKLSATVAIGIFLVPARTGFAF